MFKDKYPLEQIRNTALQYGWPEEIVNRIFAEFEKKGKTERQGKKNQSDYDLDSKYKELMNKITSPGLRHLGESVHEIWDKLTQEDKENIEVFNEENSYNFLIKNI